jgi:siderophore synthetase component
MKLHEQVALTCVLNCYLRETMDLGIVQYANDKQSLTIRLGGQTLIVKLRYYSQVQRHLFHFPLMMRMNDGEHRTLLDLAQVIHYLLAGLADVGEDMSLQLDDTIKRILESAGRHEVIFQHRLADLAGIYRAANSFIDNEQALLVGHALQPDPKSRQPFSDEDFVRYSPEMKASFPLHYYLVTPHCIVEDSITERATSDIVKQTVVDSSHCPSAARQLIDQYAQYKLLPVHPWQAGYLQRQQLLPGDVIDLGCLGEAYWPTTSVRTVYGTSVPYMFKFSLNVAITNSIRKNQYKELQRGLAAARLWHKVFKPLMAERFPHFDIITDPGFITAKIGDTPIDESGCILRDNPFYNRQKVEVTNLATLCQDYPGSRQNRLYAIIQQLAQDSGEPVHIVASRWFQQFLQVMAAPILWLYSEFGLAVEAHQQNVVLVLEDGFPVQCYYRDNQGYYYLRDHPALTRLVDPTWLVPLCECDKTFIEHHFNYYFIVNNILSMINALGVTGLIAEAKLLREFKIFLTQFPMNYQTDNGFVSHLLTIPTLPVKCNLLTRLQGLDELVAPLSQQSVYRVMPNPIHSIQGVK